MKASKLRGLTRLAISVGCLEPARESTQTNPLGFWRYRERAQSDGWMTECIRVDALPFMSLLVHSGNVQGPVKANLKATPWKIPKVHENTALPCDFFFCEVKAFLQAPVLCHVVPRRRTKSWLFETCNWGTQTGLDLPLQNTGWHRMSWSVQQWQISKSMFSDKSVLMAPPSLPQVVRLAATMKLKHREVEKHENIWKSWNNAKAATSPHPHIPLPGCFWDIE